MLTDVERTNYYRSLDLPTSGIDEIERLRSASPMRKVGGSAMTNMVCYLWSPMMNRHLVCESRSCEALCYMQKEFDGEALEIYPQVKLMRVERESAKGHRTTEPLYCDALMLGPSGISFVECKYESQIEKLAAKNPREWVKHGDRWSRPAVERWAEARGCRYEIWSPREPHAYLLSNLEVLSALSTHNESPVDEPLVRRVLDFCSDRVVTLADIESQLGRYAAALALGLIATRRLFGNLASSLIETPESVFLHVDKTRIHEIDNARIRQIANRLTLADVNDPILRATSTDYQAGIKRLNRAEAMIRGDEPVTERYKALVKRVKIALTAGTSPLAECITSYFNCGPRGSKLDVKQDEAIEHVYKTYWKTGISTTLKDLYARLDSRCKEQGVEDVPSKQTLRNRIAPRPTTSHDTAVGGNRRYHDNKPRSDPRDRSLKALAPMQVVHIDATKFDHRSAAVTLPEYPFSCPVLYTAIDQATNEVIGRSLSFGPPSRFGLGLLFRDILRRKGRLPLCIVADRGSELWSKMAVQFCLQYHISMYMRPAGAGSYGSEIENALREINANVAHRLVGSTLPDQQGRNVDGRFKSRKTARLAFGLVVGEVDHFLFNVWLDRPVGEVGVSPRERKSELTGVAPIGRPATYDANFEIATSVPLRSRYTPRGLYVNALYRDYASTNLSDKLRQKGKPDEFRLDCADPTRAYARFGKEWVMALSQGSLELQVKEELDRIFHREYTRDQAKINRLAKHTIEVQSLDRIDHANASKPSTVDVQPARGIADTEAASPTNGKTNADDWDFTELEVPVFGAEHEG